MKELNSKIIRWRLKLEEYDFEIKYRPCVEFECSLIGNKSDDESDSDEPNSNEPDPVAGASPSTVHSAVNEPVINIPIVEKTINLICTVL